MITALWELHMEETTTDEALQAFTQSVSLTIDLFGF